MDKDKSKGTGKAAPASGNFKDDPERAAEAGRKGGQSSGASKSAGDAKKSQSSGRK